MRPRRSPTRSRTVLTTWPDGTIHLWHFNEGTGTTAADSAGRLDTNELSAGTLLTLNGGTNYSVNVTALNLTNRYSTSGAISKTTNAAMLIAAPNDVLVITNISTSGTGSATILKLVGNGL